MKRYLALTLTVAAVVMLLASAPALAKDCWYYESYGKHDYEQTDVGYASCTSDGYYMVECRQCGASQKYVTEKAYGHDWERVDKESASCTESGYTEYECSRCGKSRKESTKALGHKYSRVKLLEEASCLSKGSELVSCSRCGAQTTRSIDKTDHSYGPWQVSIEASDISKGVRSRNCTTCGKEQQEEYYPEGTLYRGISDKEAVRDLQQKLLELGYLNSKVDGIFGKDTERAVRSFAADEALPQDGVAWPAILNRLSSIWSGEPETSEPEAAPSEETVAEPAQAASHCICDENGVWTMCENHAQLHETALMFDQASKDDEGRIRMLRQVRALWQEELDILYETWMQNAQNEEEMGMIISSRAGFANFLATQEAMWKKSLGADSPEPLERVNMALEEQCLQLCILVADE